jgi:hypothetical protein
VRHTWIFETDPLRSQQGYQAGVYDAQFFEARVAERGYSPTLPAMVCVSDGTSRNPDYGADQIAQYGRGWADTTSRPLCGYGNRYCVTAFNAGIPGSRLLASSGGWLPIPWGGNSGQDAIGQDANTPSPIGNTDLNRVWVDWFDAPPAPVPAQPEDEEDMTVWITKASAAGKTNPDGSAVAESGAWNYSGNTKRWVRIDEYNFAQFAQSISGKPPLVALPVTDEWWDSIPTVT